MISLCVCVCVMDESDTYYANNFVAGCGNDDECERESRNF